MGQLVIAILKFSYQNECNDDLVKEFLKIKDYSKFVLVGAQITYDSNEIVFKKFIGKENIDETINFDR